jgi:demethylmenaquinone methyltransferase/2-methoxy-6-polyprenyl-1,4-benzoquinol methylase
MLAVGAEKLARRRLAQRIQLLDGDALATPFAGGSFDVVTIACGLRNLPDYSAGIREMTRVLKPGGRLLILEFFPPRGGVLQAAYRFYLRTILPVTGRLLSGSADAYHYLSESINNFISHEEIRTHMTTAGLNDVRGKRLTAGIAYIYTGRHP